MPKIDIGPFIQSIAVALILFAIGRYITIQTDGLGRWVIFAALIIFYAAWWVWYSRGKRKK
jgi:membrane protein DedA with SNARE-associated domain